MANDAATPLNDHATREVAQDTGQLIHQAGQKTAESVIRHSEKYSDAYVAMNKIIASFWERVPYLLIGLVVFGLFWLLAKLFKYFVHKTLYDRAYTKQNLVLVLNRVGSTFILFFGFLIALVIVIPGFSPAQLVSALGIGSVAIGFAFKDIFQNLLSGVLILISEPFRIGDTVVINNFEGTVEDIQIRATFLRSYDGRRIVIPNATVYTSPITVNTAYQRRRCEFSVGISYQDDLEQTRELIATILDQHPQVLDTPKPTIEVIALTDTAVQLMVRWWIDIEQTNIPASVSAIQGQVKQAFADNGVTLPTLTQDITLHQAPAPVTTPTQQPPAHP